jgi:hypothetical protein
MAKKEMIKRKDGSYSQRGLWDNIRANKGSGKKPTAEMLKQEKKIKAESKKMSYGGSTKSKPKKAQYGTSIKNPTTAGQAYLKYIRGASPSDTLGTDDTRERYPGFAENHVDSWPARNMMLDLTYGKNSVESDSTGPGKAAYKRISQNPKTVEEYSKALESYYKKKGGSVSAYKKDGSVKAKKEITTKHFITMAKAKKSATSKKMNYGGMAKMKSGGSKFPDLTGDGKVTQADILKGRGVIKRNGGVNASMSDRMKNPKSASMMRYGGMKKAQFGKSMPPTPPSISPSRPTSQPERLIERALRPSANQVQKKEMEEKASVAKVQARQAGRNARAIERTDRMLQKQASKEANIKTRQENKTARQQSKNEKQVAVAKIIANKNKMDTKKKGGSVKHGKKK